VSGGTPTAARRVLVVEDEGALAFLLEDMLLELGHTVIAVVARVEDALSLGEDEYDFAVLDVNLNGQRSYGLAERLRAAGYEPGYAWMKFARPAAEAPAARTDLRLEVVGAERAQDFAVPVVGGFGMPPRMLGATGALPGRAGWTCLVAYDGDRPVAGGAVFVDGEQAWLGLGATLPQARGRGAQSALLAERIRLAAEAGATTVTTETGVRQDGRPERSYRNILRAGFRPAYLRPNYVSPPADAVA